MLGKAEEAKAERSDRAESRVLSGPEIGALLGAASPENRSDTLSTVPAGRFAACLPLVAVALSSVALKGGFEGAVVFCASPPLRPEAAAVRMLFGVSACMEEEAERAVFGSCRELREDGICMPMLESMSELMRACGIGTDCMWPGGALEGGAGSEEG